MFQISSSSNSLKSIHEVIYIFKILFYYNNNIFMKYLQLSGNKYHSGESKLMLFMYK